MSDEFMSHSGIKWQGHVGTVEYGGGDRTMIAMFYTKAVHSPQKSLQDGRPVFEDMVYVRIHPPGERLNIVDRPARDDDRRRWPLQWAQFNENRQQIPDGTPIDLLYPDQPSVSALLRGHAVHTIEQCAELSANAIENIGMGAQTYVNAAKKYLEASAKGVGASQLRKELEERDGQIRTLNHKIELLTAQLDQMQKASSQAVDLQQIQTLLAGIQGRPQFPSNNTLPQQFDAQSAQIAANHVTADVSRAKRPRQRIKN